VPGQDLEAPCGSDPDWSRLYRASGDEVVPHRPIFTGDVFKDVSLYSVDGNARTRTVMVVQHPCAMRVDGVQLASSLLVAEVSKHKVVPPEDWTKYHRLMPLPDLLQATDKDEGHRAAFFTKIYLVSPDNLQHRVACLSQLGVNLLLQRWVHHNSRVIVPTATYEKQTSGVIEEADLLEEWCEERLEQGLSVTDATAEGVDWLRELPPGQEVRQKQLEDPQLRSQIRKDMRRHLRSLRPTAEK
jgi:hypothetical protein